MLLGRECSPQPPQQKAQFRLQPAVNYCHQNQIKRATPFYHGKRNFFNKTSPHFSFHMQLICIWEKTLPCFLSWEQRAAHHYNCYQIYSSITCTLNFLIENWYKFFFTFSQLRPRIVNDKCCWKCAAITKHLFTTYGTLVKQTTSMNWTQHLCCNVNVLLYVAIFCIITS